MTDTWHADPDLLARLATGPTGVDPVSAASAEQHLLSCATCRRELARSVRRDELDGIWAEIADSVDQVPDGAMARWLRAVGLGGTRSRLVVATADLRASALAAVTLISVVAIVAAGRADSPRPFLAFAPLVVLGTVALCFRPSSEPAGEAAGSTPMFGYHLFLLRAAAVVGATVVPLMVASLLLPATPVEALAWVLPTLGLVLFALSLAPRVAPSTMAVASAAAWVAGLWLHGHVTRSLPSVDGLASPTVQVAGFALAVGSLVHLWATRDDFDRLTDRTGGLVS